MSTITYDAMGNPTSYLGKTLTWEGKQLTGYSHGSTGISYAYNEDGLRLQKIVNNETTEYCYNGSVLIGMKVGTGNTAKILRFSYDASGNAAAVDYSADNGSTFTTYYYVRNAQNDVVKLIDGSGNTVVEYLYDSWGKSISVTGTLATTLGADQPFRYRGYVYDTETQWYYLQSRYYDPATCRFISADVLLSTGQGVIGHNSFAYCLNNPINNEDDTGAKTKGLGGKAKLYKLLFLYADITETGFIIDLKSDPDAWDREFKKLGKNKAYRAMAEYLCDSYKAKYDCEFLFSVKCVTNEIAYHANAYMWAIGKKGYSRNVTTAVLSNKRIIAHCKEIDISTNDALKFRDPFLFQYPFHVRKQYLFTDKNPYFVLFKYSMQKVVIL